MVLHEAELEYRVIGRTRKSYKDITGVDVCVRLGCVDIIVRFRGWFSMLVATVSDGATTVEVLRRLKHEGCPLSNQAAGLIHNSAAAYALAAQNRARSLSLVTAALLCGGLVLAVAASWLALDAYRFIAVALPVNGIVSRLVETRSQRLDSRSSSVQYSYTYAAVFRFRAPGKDEMIEALSSHSSSHPGYAAGQSIRLLVDPADPQRAIDAVRPGPWGDAIVSGIISLVLLTAGGLTELIRRCLAPLPKEKIN